MPWAACASSSRRTRSASRFVPRTAACFRRRFPVIGSRPSSTVTIHEASYRFRMWPGIRSLALGQQDSDGLTEQAWLPEQHGRWIPSGHLETEPARDAAAWGQLPRAQVLPILARQQHAGAKIHGFDVALAALDLEKKGVVAAIAPTLVAKLNFDQQELVAVVGLIELVARRPHGLEYRQHHVSSLYGVANPRGRRLGLRLSRRFLLG